MRQLGVVISAFALLLHEIALRLADQCWQSPHDRGPSCDSTIKAIRAVEMSAIGGDLELFGSDGIRTEALTLWSDAFS
ncbi:MAG: hypothetical protein MZV49_15215 [Rhodopseudomonas palustris]|nr:hypothetical protein [Rhodopseudomonas palustris]